VSEHQTGEIASLRRGERLQACLQSIDDDLGERDGPDARLRLRRPVRRAVTRNGQELSVDRQCATESSWGRFDVGNRRRPAASYPDHTRSTRLAAGLANSPQRADLDPPDRVVHEVCGSSLLERSEATSSRSLSSRWSAGCLAGMTELRIGGTNGLRTSKAPKSPATGGCGEERCRLVVESSFEIGRLEPTCTPSELEIANGRHPRWRSWPNRFGLTSVSPPSGAACADAQSADCVAVDQNEGDDARLIRAVGPDVPGPALDKRISG
jgi:hypothetical protein